MSSKLSKENKSSKLSKGKRKIVVIEEKILRLVLSNIVINSLSKIIIIELIKEYRY